MDRTFDELGRVDWMSVTDGTELEERTWTYDDRGRVESMDADGTLGPRHHGYAYAEPGWLTDEWTDTTHTHYAYDGGGNRTSRDIDGVVTTYGITTGNRVSSVDGAPVGWSPFGEVDIDHRGYGLARDAVGLEVEVEEPGGTPILEIRRDPFGKAEGLSDGTTDVHQLWGGSPWPVVSDDGSGARLNVVAEGELLGVFDGSTMDATLTDPLGTPAWASGGVVPEAPAFGEGTAGTGAPGAPTYASLQTLPDSPYHLAGVRLYDPELGRFASSDPIGLGGGLHRFAYVGNAPLNLVDPSGMLGQKPTPGTGKPTPLGGVGMVPWGAEAGASHHDGMEAPRISSGLYAQAMTDVRNFEQPQQCGCMGCPRSESYTDQRNDAEDETDSENEDGQGGDATGSQSGPDEPASESGDSPDDVCEGKCDFDPVYVEGWFEKAVGAVFEFFSGDGAGGSPPEFGAPPDTSEGTAPAAKEEGWVSWAYRTYVGKREGVVKGLNPGGWERDRGRGFQGFNDRRFSTNGLLDGEVSPDDYRASDRIEKQAQGSEELARELVDQAVIQGLTSGGGKLVGKLVGKGAGAVESAAAKAEVEVLEEGVSKGAGNLTVLGTSYSGVELNAASEVARLGRDVVMRDPTGARSAAGATADLLVDGVPMDIYSPEAGTSVNNIFRTMASKNDQARGIVLDLNMWDGSVSDLGDVTARLQGKLAAQGSAVNLQEVIVVGR